MRKFLPSEPKLTNIFLDFRSKVLILQLTLFNIWMKHFIILNSANCFTKKPVQVQNTNWDLNLKPMLVNSGPAPTTYTIVFDSLPLSKVDSWKQLRAVNGSYTTTEEESKSSISIRNLCLSLSMYSSESNPRKRWPTKWRLITAGLLSQSVGIHLACFYLIFAIFFINKRP